MTTSAAAAATPMTPKTANEEAETRVKRMHNILRESRALMFLQVYQSLPKHVLYTLTKEVIRFILYF